MEAGDPSAEPDEPVARVISEGNGPGQPCRRSFLGMAGTLGVAALGGCTGTLASGDDDGDGTSTAGGDVLSPEHPSLFLYSADHDAVYTADALGAYHPDAMRGRIDFEHPDTDAVATELTDDAFTLAFTGAVARPVTVAVNLTGAGLPYRGRDPAFREENPLALATTLAPTATAEAFRTGEPRALVESQVVEFDLTDVALPRNVTIHADVCLVDGGDDPRILAHHGALPLAYTVAGEERLRWLDESARVRRGRAVHEEPPTHCHDHFEDGDHRVSYGIGEHEGHRWAVGVALDIAEMEHYAEHGDAGWYPHGLRAANTAHTDPTVRRFARRFARTLDTAGVTDPLERLDALADYVQTIPYRIPEDGGRKLTYTLYSRVADCSEKTFLFAGVCRCDPWTTRVGYVYGRRGENAHTLPAIHVEELRAAGVETDSMATVTPSELPRIIDGQRFVDDEFALVEVTADREMQIGDFEPEQYELEYVYGTNFWGEAEA